MWTCPSCGEANEDHFQACWKCLGETLPSAALSAPEPSPRPLRSLGSIVARAFIAFCFGTLVGVAISHRHSTPFAEAAVFGLILGAFIGGFVGIFLWVVFPYQPGSRARISDAEDPAE